MANTKKKTTKRETPQQIMNQIKKKRSQKAPKSEINKLLTKYMNSINYK